MARIVLFSTNDFTTTSGGTIRMYGILNALAENNNEVIFISNCLDYSGFNEKIQHLYIDHPINQYSKRKFQFLLTYLPLKLFNLYYKKLLKKLKDILKSHKEDNVIFFEYLDNSIGYWLFKNNLIQGYINDIHGIAPEEFNFQIQQAHSIKEKLKLILKAHTAKKLDRKVFKSAEKVIFPTHVMLEYWGNKFSSVFQKENIILPNVLQAESNLHHTNPILVEKIKNELNIQGSQRILLFAGGFKKSSGLLTLIKAFSLLAHKNLDIKLILLGDGPLYTKAQKMVAKLGLKEVIHFAGFTDYCDLRSYQEVSDILICPDDDNVFSHLIVHFKYLDALLANKVVINGNFKSVLEINPKEELSLGFEPSNVEDLARVIQDALENYSFYHKKYSNTREFVLSQMTYRQQTKILEV